MSFVSLSCSSRQLKVKAQLPLVWNPFVSLVDETLVHVRLLAIELDLILLHQIHKEVYVVPHVVAFKNMLLVSLRSNLVECFSAIIHRLLFETTYEAS